MIARRGAEAREEARLRQATLNNRKPGTLTAESAVSDRHDRESANQLAKEAEIASLKELLASESCSFGGFC